MASIVNFPSAAEIRRVAGEIQQVLGNSDWSLAIDIHPNSVAGNVWWTCWVFIGHDAYPVDCPADALAVVRRAAQSSFGPSAEHPDPDV